MSTDNQHQLIREARWTAAKRCAAAWAHDLRNPLSAIRSAAFLLRRKLARGELAQADEYLEIIERELSAAEGIIRKSLSIFHDAPPQPELVDLDELIDAARQGLPSADRIDWRREGPPLLLFVDREQFLEVLRNLFLNSIKAFGPGGGKITVVSQRGDDTDEFRVIDTGPGIAAEHAEIVFEPLFTTRETAVGLGLTVCRRIVERHGGAISVEPNAPGAVVCIRLPRMPAERPRP